jgi:hypothetical protein
MIRLLYLLVSLDRRRSSELLTLLTCGRNAFADGCEKAMVDRFYCRYHPIHALKNSRLLYGSQVNGDQTTPILLMTKLDSSHLKHCYLIDMQVMLYPGLQNGALLKKMINTLEIDDCDIPNGWNSDLLRKEFYKLITQFIWGSITRYTEMVA